jgi:phosphate starvation-inducible PhoH-like protein
MNLRRSVSSFVKSEIMGKRLPIVMNRATSKGMGKSRNRYRYRDMIEDEEELFGSSFPFDEDYVGTVSGGASRRTPNIMSYMKEWKAAPAIKARNPLQERYIHLLENIEVPIVVAYGAAGTGKTMLPNALGIQKLINGDIDKIIITRPVISVGPDQIGYLPGTLEQKMDPWLRPIYDVFYRYMNPQQVQNLIAKQQIEICPLAYMRGRTFENAWICADEMQNSTPNQMLMLLTRIGHKSKLVINGDPAQHDRGYETNGLVDLLMRLEHQTSTDIQVLHFTEDYVERHHAIKKILRMYNTNSVPG